MDKQFYVDTRAPHMGANFPLVTLTGSPQAIIPASGYPRLGGNYFGWVGKAVRMTILGTINTGATPGNIFWPIYWGNGGNGSGTIINDYLGSGGNVSVTNNIFVFTLIIRCRAIGSNGSLLLGGSISMSGWGMECLPTAGSAPSVTTGLDLTQDYIPSFQAYRTGSTTETLQVNEFIFEALN